MSVCPGCGASGQHEGARFCFSCGLGLQAPGCGACGFELAPGSRFCPSCGAAQSGAGAPAQPAVQPPVPQQVASRRITSVLFGDLVGFTTLSETRDQEDVRELLSGYFESCSQVIARYGGTVEKFIGDAVMAVWGVPTAHEDDAERAVRAGLELVNLITALGTDLGVPDLAMRVGIVTGEVAVTVGATQQGMVAGDAVNTAARVQTAALPGQVWVDETTRLLTSSAVTYADVGSHAMKGKADPMPLWSVRAVVAGVGGSQRADGLEAPHVGRDRELRLVKELFHGAEEHKRPALLVVSGEAGVGKTRLGWEFFKYVDGLTRSSWWHQGRCLSYGEGVAFYALAEAIRGRLQNVRADNADTEAQAEDQQTLLEEGLARFVPDAEERTWLQPRLGALLGMNAVGNFKREDLFSAWTRFLQRLSDDGDPVVLLIDDAQHADDGLLDFVEHLLAVGSFPCFAMLLARPSLLEKRPTLTTNRRASVIHLDNLGTNEMSALLDGLVTGLPDAARTALVDRAEGIPLYAVETVRSLIDRDLVVPRGGQYVLAESADLDLDAIAAPASLQALISARLDTLDTDLRRLIDQASVLGNSFTREAIEGLCPDLHDLDGTLAQLVRLQLLSQEASRFSTELGQYRFVQTGVRQVAYGTLSRRDRKASHLAVVQQLEADDDPADELAPIIAQHYLEALDAVPDELDSADLAVAAVDHLRRAAARASALGAPAEAAGHLRTALDRTADRLERARIELELARQLQRLADHHGATVHAESAVETFDELGDVVAAGAAVAVRARALSTLAGDHSAAIAMAEERYEALRGHDDAVAVQLELLRAALGAKYAIGEPLGAISEEKARLAELSGDSSEIADSHISLSLHYGAVGALSLSRSLMQSAADLARRDHDTVMQVRALTNLTSMWTEEDMSQALDTGREVVPLAKTLGDAMWASNAAINCAFALILAGEWDEVEQLIPASWEYELQQPMWSAAESFVRVSRGGSWQPPAAGDSDEDDRLQSGFRNLTRALTGAAQGERAAAALAVVALREVHEVVEIFDDFVLLLTIATRVAVTVDDREALREMDAIVDSHHPGTHSRGLRAVRAHHRGLAAIWDEGEPEIVEKHLRGALTEAETWGAGLVHAQIAADLGVWLTQQGRTDEAVPLLEVARARFAKMGATPWLTDLDARVSGVSA